MQNIKQLIWDDRISQLEVCSKDWSFSARFKMIGIGVGRDDQSTIQVNSHGYSCKSSRLGIAAKFRMHPI